MTKHIKNLLPTYVAGCCNGIFTEAQASASTGYSIGHIAHLKKLYKLYGDSAFVSKRKGMPAKNRISSAIRAQVVNIYNTEYKGDNFASFRDCLEEFHDLNYSYRTIYNILMENGITSPEKRHIKKIDKVHRPRIRRQNEGDLLQFDGTPFDWFGDGHKYSMHGAVDDATGKITGLYICENECLYGYMEVIRITAEKFGLFREAYTDRAAIFCFTPRHKEELTIAEQLAGLHEKRTQWQNLLDRLSINQVLAWTPQAKGRVERMWRTLQGRLPAIFRKKGIKDIETANRFLFNWIDKYNKKFAIEPAKPAPFWRKVDAETLDAELCAQFPREITKAGYIKFQGYKFLVDAPHCGGKNALLCISEKGITAKIGNLFYNVQLMDDLQQIINDQVPEVLYAIIYKYMYADAKKVSV